jgi:peptide/nickel transport system substrate-binding protein
MIGTNMLVEDIARPVILYPRRGTCRKPEPTESMIMVNSIYNGWRYENAWLDR